jgi:uncharacterized membrane protein YfcA
MNCVRCGIKDAVFYQTLALGAALPVLLYQSRVIIREHRNAKLLLVFVPATAAGTPLGNFLQEHIPSDIVRLVVGIVITFALTNTLRKIIPETACWKKFAPKDKQTEHDNINSKIKEGENCDEENKDSNVESAAEEDEEETLPGITKPKRRNDIIDVDVLTGNALIIWGSIAGFFSGFLGGLVGIRGPPLMVFFLSFPFPKNVVRANSMLILIVNIVIRTCYYIIEDVSGARELSWFQSDLWYLYVCVIVCGVFGVPLGQFVANRIDQNQFNLVIAFMLFISGLSNIIKGSVQVAQRAD